MEAQKLNRYLIILSLLFLIAGISLLIFRKKLISFFTPAKVEPETEPEATDNDTEILLNQNPTIDFYKLTVDVLKGWDDQSVRMLVAQARHETGNFTSNLYRKHNNAFGMMFPRMRPTTAESETESGYSHYETVADSIRDMEHYFAYKEYPKLSSFQTMHEYAKYLKANAYFTAPTQAYGNALTKHFNQLKNILQ